MTSSAVGCLPSRGTEKEFASGFIGNRQPRKPALTRTMA
jgi:hypothetical protein